MSGITGTEAGTLSRLAPEPASIVDAMSNVVDAGERLVSHRLELTLVELRRAIEGAQQTVQLTLVALLLAGSGWIFGMLAIESWLETFLSPAVATLCVAVLQLTVGALLFLNRRRILGGP